MTKAALAQTATGREDADATGAEGSARTRPRRSSHTATSVNAAISASAIGIRGSHDTAVFMRIENAALATSNAMFNPGGSRLNTSAAGIIVAYGKLASARSGTWYRPRKTMAGSAARVSAR